jgi:hypothetical protein
MEQKVAVLAQIRPGCRDKLAQELENGPPFDLAEHGFSRHEAFLGDTTLVLVFEGTHAGIHLHKLAAALPLTTLTRIGMLVSRPQLLPEFWVWEPAAATTGT